MLFFASFLTVFVIFCCTKLDFQDFKRGFLYLLNINLIFIFAFCASILYVFFMSLRLTTADTGMGSIQAETQNRRQVYSVCDGM